MLDYEEFSEKPQYNMATSHFQTNFPILPYASFYSKKFSDPPPFLAIFKKLNPPPSFMKGREACLNYVTLGQTEIY